MNRLSAIRTHLTRGVGILEVSIALIVITICSAAIITIVQNYGSASAKSAHDDEAIMLVKNAIQLFEVAGTQDEFAENLARLTDESFTEEEQWYTFESDYSRVTIYASFEEDDKPAQTFTLTAYAWDEDGEELISVEGYERVNANYVVQSN